jgi:hypothetical protein
MVILNFRRTRPIGISYAVPMTWRNSVRKRSGAVALAVAVCGLVPAGSVWAEEPLDPPPTTPDDGDGEAPDEPVDEAVPETGEVDGATVAVGAPPVPPVSDEPQVAVGQPPVPPVADEPQVAVGQPPVPPVADEPQVAVGQPPVPPAALLASAALDLVAACL